MPSLSANGEAATICRRDLDTVGQHRRVLPLDVGQESVIEEWAPFRIARDELDRSRGLWRDRRDEDVVVPGAGGRVPAAHRVDVQVECLSADTAARLGERLFVGQPVRRLERAHLIIERVTAE